MTTRTTIYLNDDYKELIKTMAYQTDKNQSELIRAALESYMISEEYQIEKERTMRIKEMKHQREIKNIQNK